MSMMNTDDVDVDNYDTKVLLVVTPKNIINTITNYNHELVKLTNYLLFQTRQKHIPIIIIIVFKTNFLN